MLLRVLTAATSGGAVILLAALAAAAWAGNGLAAQTGSLSYVSASRRAARGMGNCSELLVNGGFEQNELGWNAQASPPLPAGVSLIDAFYPRAGALGAYLAGRNGAVDRLSQAVALPAGADSITLDLWK